MFPAAAKCTLVKFIEGKHQTGDLMEMLKHPTRLKKKKKELKSHAELAAPVELLA